MSIYVVVDSFTTVLGCYQDQIVAQQRCNKFLGQRVIGPYSVATPPKCQIQQKQLDQESVFNCKEFQQPLSTIQHQIQQTQNQKQKQLIHKSFVDYTQPPHQTTNKKREQSFNEGVHLNCHEMCVHLDQIENPKLSYTFTK